MRQAEQPEMDSFLKERNHDQKWPETETYQFAQKVCCTHVMQLWKMNSSESLVIERAEANLLKSAYYY